MTLTKPQRNRLAILRHDVNPLSGSVARYALLIFLAVVGAGIKKATSQTVDDRAQNAINRFGVTYTIDNSIFNLGEDNYQGNFYDQTQLMLNALNQDSRHLARYIVPYVKVVHTTEMSGTSNPSIDIGNFYDLLEDPSNNYSTNNYQIFATYVTGYDGYTSTYGINEDGWGAFVMGYSGYGLPNGDVSNTTAHELLHVMAADNGSHQQGRTGMDYTVYVDGGGVYPNDNGKSIGAANTGGYYLPTYTVSATYNVNSVANGGNGIFTYNFSENGSTGHVDIPVDQMHNNTGFTDVTTGVDNHFENLPSMLPSIPVDQPDIPVQDGNTADNNLSLSNLGSFNNVSYSNTEATGFPEYAVDEIAKLYLYNGDNSVDGAQIDSTAIGGTFTDLENGTYALAVYFTYSNGLRFSNTITIDFDGIPPTPTISSAEPDPTNAENFILNISFDEDMNQSSLQLSDFSTANCSVSNLTWTDVANCEVTVTPGSDGTVGVNLPANSCTDIAGNGNIAGSFSIEIDQTEPLPELDSNEAYNTNATSFEVQLDFNNEPNGVSGVEVSDFYTENCTVSDLNGSGSNYTYTLTPSWEGPLLARYEANSCMDAATNENVVSENLEHIVDWTSSFPQMTSSAPSIVGAGTYEVVIDFYNGEEGDPEDVTGFTQSDITAIYCTLSNFQGSGSAYSFDFTPVANGTLSLGIAANICQDLAGNDNNAAFNLTRIADLDILTPTLSSDENSPTNTESLTMLIEFSEPIDPATLTLSDYESENCSLSDLTTINDSVFQLTVNYTLDETATVILLENSCSTSFGKENIEGSFSIVFDQTPPQITIEGPIEISMGEDAEMTYTANEPIVGFDNSDIEVDNGNSINFMGSGNEYTSTIVDVAIGQTFVNVVGDYQDMAGNSGLAVEEFTFQILTGTSELSTIEGIKVYPNPAKSLLTIETDESVSDIEIINTTGHIVFEKNIPVKISSSSSQIDISELPRGIYIIKIMSEQGDSKTVRFIKE